MILLINPPAYDFKAFDMWLSPYGLLSIASALEKKGYEIKLFDFLDRFHPSVKKFSVKNSRQFGCGKFYSREIEKPGIYKNIPRKYKKYGIPWEVFENEMKKIPAPDLILVTTLFTYWYPGAHDTLKRLRKIFPESKILLGGIYPIISKKHAEKYSGADLVIAERSIPGIVETIEKIVPSPGNGKIPGFPIPDFSGYNELHHGSIMISTGCPFSCNYCSTPVLEKKMKWANPEEIFDLVTCLYKEKAVIDFAFYDDALLYRAKEFLVPFLEKILNSGLKLRFHTPNALHCRFITAEIAEYLKKSGFTTIRLGLETVDLNIQKKLGKKTSLEEFELAVINLKRAGFAPHQIGAYLLSGFPGMSISSLEQSIKSVHKCGVKSYIAQFSPIPGTPLGDEFLKNMLPSYPEDFDPLYTNNTYWWFRSEKYPEMENLKLLSLELNRQLIR
ncbi:MAG: radical SAM protein [Candidatus Eremiobacteraeota bacterium]|nr:radical SAM protein [Candidatus Eremiobacteraeota bacterium]